MWKAALHRQMQGRSVLKLRDQGERLGCWVEWKAVHKHTQPPCGLPALEGLTRGLQQARGLPECLFRVRDGNGRPTGMSRSDGDTHRKVRGIWYRFTFEPQVLDMELDCLTYELFHFLSSFCYRDADGKVRDIRAPTSFTTLKDNGVFFHSFSSNCACRHIAFSIPGGTSAPGCPAKVTVPRFVR